METNYGTADRFCGTLANGQYMVVLTDFSLCDQLHGDASSRYVFHTMDETNLRLVFPSTLCKTYNPNAPACASPPQMKAPVNSFTVGKTTCSDTPSGVFQAAAFFAHNTAGAADYDVNALADSGTITVTYPDQGANELKGTFDLTFGADHITGSYDALYCRGVLPGVGL
jgi:hypothetical protein